MPSPSNRWQKPFSLLALVASLALLVRVLSAADLRRVADLIGIVGLSGVVVILLPQIVSLAVESYGWKLAVRVLGHEVGFKPLLRIRVATEALAQSLPAGIVFCESIRPLLLARHCGLRVSEGVAAIVARKYLLIASQAVYTAVMVTLGLHALQQASVAITGTAGLPWLSFGAAAALVLLAAGMSAFLRDSGVARGIFGLLRRLPSRRVSLWLATCERRFAETDRSVAGFFRQGLRKRAVPGLFFLFGWLLEAIETYLIMTLLGANLGFFEIAGIEVMVTFVRNVVFFVPAGLGFQDIGYVTSFAALGVPEAASVGSAFVLLKRAKELFWIGIGYALLALESKELRRAPAALGVNST